MTGCSSFHGLRVLHGIFLLAIAAILAGCANWPAPWPTPSVAPAAQVSAATRGTAAALQDGAWSTLYVQGSGATAEPRPYLQWTQAAQITGSGGCNRFVGQGVVTEPEQLRFASLASTRMACMTEPGGQEDKFFVALELTRQARLEGDDLILLDQTGGVLAQLRRVDPKALAQP